MILGPGLAPKILKYAEYERSICHCNHRTDRVHFFGGESSEALGTFLANPTGHLANCAASCKIRLRGPPWGLVFERVLPSNRMQLAGMPDFFSPA